MLIEFPGKVRVSVGTPLGEPHYPRLDQIESGEQPFHLGAGARGGWDGYLFAQFTCSFPLLGAALHGPVGDGQEAAGGEAGYSNLAYLHALPVHGLKLASTFVRGLRSPVADSTDEAILTTLVSLGHTLGLTVTAEGIETGAQARQLRAIGCDVGQGWLFGHPQPPGQITHLITGVHPAAQTAP